ncbi:MAG: hypothetical protein Q9M45_11370 [Robiginitomaculum sp.]|nr:hypothetical protein [Robiginitomaculum sp.]
MGKRGKIGILAGKRHGRTHGNHAASRAVDIDTPRIGAGNTANVGKIVNNQYAQFGCANGTISIAIIAPKIKFMGRSYPFDTAETPVAVFFIGGTRVFFFVLGGVVSANGPIIAALRQLMPRPPRAAVLVMKKELAL